MFGLAKKQRNTNEHNSVSLFIYNIGKDEKWLYSYSQDTRVGLDSGSTLIKGAQASWEFPYFETIFLPSLGIRDT